MKEKLKKLPRILFYLSFLYYLYWFGYCLYVFFAGIDAGWLFSETSSGRLIYGWEALYNGFAKFVVCTIFFFWIVPLYQIGDSIFRTSRICSGKEKSLRSIIPNCSVMISTFNVTANFYSHLDPRCREQSAEKIAKVLGGESKKDRQENEDEKTQVFNLKTCVFGAADPT